MPKGEAGGILRRYTERLKELCMAVAHEGKITVTCKFDPADIKLNCEELGKHGPAGAEAIEILRGLGEVVSRLNQASGIIRLAVSVSSAGVIKSGIDLASNRSSESLPEVAKSWDLNIANVNFSLRARRVLEGEDLRTLGEVAMKTERQLRRVTGCGSVTCGEIKQTLAKHGLSLNMKGKPGVVPG